MNRNISEERLKARASIGSPEMVAFPESSNPREMDNDVDQKNKRQSMDNVLLPDSNKNHFDSTSENPLINIQGVQPENPKIYMSAEFDRLNKTPAGVLANLSDTNLQNYPPMDPLRLQGISELPNYHSADFKKRKDGQPNLLTEKSSAELTVEAPHSNVWLKKSSSKT